MLRVRKGKKHIEVQDGSVEVIGEEKSMKYIKFRSDAVELGSSNTSNVNGSEISMFIDIASTFLLVSVS